MILEFFKIASNLKNVPRQGWIKKLDIKDPESVADHSYSVALFSMVISDLAKYDSEKVLKMALLHDLAESEIGDYTPSDIPKEEKTKLEEDAFIKIMGHLPDSIKTEYLEIWQEYQANNSDEARILHQIDKLEMALQAKTYQKEQKTGYEDIRPFLESAKNSITDPKLADMLAVLEKE